MKRRGFLKFGLFTAAIGGLAYWKRNEILRFGLTSLTNDETATLAPQAGADVCMLTPEQTAGPYFIKAPMRSDITDGKKGLPLKLAVEIVNMPDCVAVEGLTVEIWHCDAPGFYSGYPEMTVREPFDTLVMVATQAKDGHIPPQKEEEKFLRGAQVTDAKGMIEFDSIFPGWYDPRLTHIHLKVSRDGKSFLTTQLFFPDEMVTDIYTNHPDYKDYGVCPYNLTNDPVLKDLSDETGVVLKTERTDELITASVRFGIAS